MSTLHEFAPAKLNLYLHITGRRADGYHDLDSLVAFAGIGDEIFLEASDTFSFALKGPQAVALQNHPMEDNLVVKAVHSLADLTGKPLDFKLTLIKNLPIASGIGGGSSDAAAALRAVARHWQLDLKDSRLVEAASRHGQDVPACLFVENNYLVATGTVPAPDLPSLSVILVNPNKALPTPSVYAAYKKAGYGFSLPARLKDAPQHAQILIDTLKTRHNDLYQPACDLMPEIKEIIAALNKADSSLARMSGSGATCFGLYLEQETARKAAAKIKADYPHWWVAQSFLPYKLIEGSR